MWLRQPLYSLIKNELSKFILQVYLEEVNFYNKQRKINGCFMGKKLNENIKLQNVVSDVFMGNKINSLIG